ncbi:MAG: rhodanese-like domain-containing protein [Bdellovibrionales bacterium]
MEIELFQLENLFLSPSRFVFWDLRQKVHGTGRDSLDQLLSKANTVQEQEIEAELSKLSARDFPIVLLCEDGRRSSQLAQQLEKKGYVNVYVVAGGVVGLLAEA